jgi:hypothetical protein
LINNYIIIEVVVVENKGKYYYGKERKGEKKKREKKKKKTKFRFVIRRQLSRRTAVHVSVWLWNISFRAMPNICINNDAFAK